MSIIYESDNVTIKDYDWCIEEKKKVIIFRCKAKFLSKKNFKNNTFWENINIACSISKRDILDTECIEDEFKQSIIEKTKRGLMR